MAHAALGGAYYSHLYNDPVRDKEHLEKAFQLSGRTTDRARLYTQTTCAQDLGTWRKPETVLHASEDADPGFPLPKEALSLKKEMDSRT